MIEDGTADLNQLVQRVAGGDDTAFAALYDQTITMVLRTAHHILRDRSHAQEVAQEVYLELWRTAATFDRQQDPRRLLKTITRRRAIDRVRSAQAARERDHRHARSSEIPDYDDVQERGDTRLAFTPVADAVRLLPAIHRDVLFLAYFQGLSHTEIAATLGLPLGTVKSRLRDTLLRLRHQLTDTSNARASGLDTTTCTLIGLGVLSDPNSARTDTCQDEDA